MIGATRSAAKSRDARARPPEREGPDLAARFVVRAAILAPSVHNTQPWRFVDRPGGLELWADRARLLPIADPAGREMVISCGAALFNARLAVRSLGFTPLVRLVPDPAYPDLLARIGWGSGTAPRPYEDLLYRTIPRRHTYRGAFLTTPLPPMLTTVLAGIARHEGAGLRVVSDLAQLRRLAEHVEVAEAAQRRDPRIAGELLAWVASPTGERRDGLSPGSYPIQPDGLAFAARDFAAATRWGRSRQGRQSTDPDAAQGADPAAVGTVAVLVTRGDRRLDWLLAGQALQHVLLHAETAGVSAAFYTQPLELPYLRAAMHRDLRGHAQMLLRLGRPARRLRSRRRPVTDVLSGERNPSAEPGPGIPSSLRGGAGS
ncbi:Acg family FMN-binding oxidoreductase [Actinomadura sediminis]|uniref:Acg family FMN-binding oxidoreductase n=1 Tax=Actinomadura sediminis TaxID=1038904 RepID=A0ABW3EJI6_9ACTN